MQKNVQILSYTWNMKPNNKFISQNYNVNCVDYVDEGEADTQLMT